MSSIALDCNICLFRLDQEHLEGRQKLCLWYLCRPDLAWSRCPCKNVLDVLPDSPSAEFILTLALQPSAASLKEMTPQMTPSFPLLYLKMPWLTFLAYLSACSQNQAYSEALPHIWNMIALCLTASTKERPVLLAWLLVPTRGRPPVVSSSCISENVIPRPLPALSRTHPGIKGPGEEVVLVNAAGVTLCRNGLLH